MGPNLTFGTVAAAAVSHDQAKQAEAPV